MPFDGFVMTSVVSELKRKIVSGRIIKIHQPEPYLIILRIRKETRNCQLLISAHPVTARIHCTGKTKENPAQAPLFCMVLRKHLEGGRITGIEQVSLERVLKIHVESFDELGSPAEKTLVVEIMGKHSNIILVDPKTSNILDGIRRYTHAVSRYREVLPGRPYLFPPDQGKEDPLKVDEEQFRALLMETPLNTKVSNAIVRCFSGFSPLLAREIIARAGLSDDTVIDNLGDYDLIRLWQGFLEIIGAAKNCCFEPTIALTPKGWQDFSCVRLLQFDNGRLLEFANMSEAMDRFFSRQEDQERFAAKQRELIKIIKAETDKLSKKLTLQNEQLQETEDAENFRLYGELITGYIYLLSPGMERAVLDNYYQPGSAVEVPLDPRFSPAENAQYYFKKYNKAKSARISIKEQIQKGQDELDYLESVLNSIDQSSALNDLQEIRSELVEAGYLKPQPVGKNKPVKPAVSQPLSFVSGDGYTILAGRNNKQNDRLTLKLAQKDDLWLHTKNIPGSHVIVRKKPGEDVPFSTIEEAAQLAAFYSKARLSSQVPVDYTYVSQVKKPNGAKPGMVIYFQQKTIYVKPAEILS